MQESLKPLRDPRLDQAEILCDLITDIRRILVHPDLQNAVKLSAIRQAVDELAPPPPPEIGQEHLDAAAGVLAGGGCRQEG